MSYFFIIILPLFGALFSGFLSFFLGRLGSLLVAVLFIFLSFLLSLSAFYNILKYGFICKISLGEWVSSEYILIKWEFLFDSVTIIMLIVVTLVSCVVHFYSVDYMRGDPYLPTFISYLSLFTFFMLFLVTSNNLLQLFLGWEGVGICSYLLISFWFTRIEAVKSALKAVMVNKLGDYFVFLGILFVFFSFNSLNFGLLFNIIYFFKSTVFIIFGFSVHLISLISFLFFLGAVGKSAQIGLHTWLPDAMEGPTPVSALIHAATMVTAGIFLIIRCSYFFEYSPKILILMVFFGSLTAFLGGSIALLQTDIKKIIAYSTCSQLGYMMFACGLSGYNIAFYHLLNHAFFKALLFLSAGIIIHSVFDEQDLRGIGKYGFNLVPAMGVWFLIIGSLAIMGFPGMSGFFSKDKILELAYSNNSFVGFFGYFFGSLTAFLTSFYSFRLIYLVLLNCESGGIKHIYKDNHSLKRVSYYHNSIHMYLGLPFLVLGSVYSGYLLEEVFVGFGTDFFSNSLSFVRNPFVSINLEYIPFIIKILPLFLSVTGAGVSYLFLSIFWKESMYFFYRVRAAYFIGVFLLKKWNFDKFYNLFSIYLLKISYEYFFKLLEKGFIEFLIRVDVVNFFYYFSAKISAYYLGNIFRYCSFLFFLFSSFFFLYQIFYFL